jgi:hypothetical protein
MLDYLTTIVVLLLFSCWDANERWNAGVVYIMWEKVENVEFKENGIHTYFSLAATVCLLLDGRSVLSGKVQVATASISGVIAAALLLLWHDGKGNVSVVGAVIGSRNT